MRDHFVNDSASPTSGGRRPCSLGKILVGMVVNSPIPDDGELPDDMEFVRAGFINDGCYAMKWGARIEPVLDWLESRAERFCFVCPEINLYNQQTWLFFPWYFADRVRLVIDPGVDVAYWNLYHKGRPPLGRLLFGTALAA